MKQIAFAAPLALIFLLFFSCDHGPMGIYHSLEVETDVTDNDTLENEITIGSMAKLGTSYYLAAGGVYYRSVELDSDWVLLSPPDGYLLSTELAVAFNTVFAIFTTQDGSSSVLHKYSSGAWVTIGDVDITAATCDALIATDDGTTETLFVSVRNSTADYTLYYSTDGASFTAVTTPVLTSPVTDGAAWLDPGSNYWLICRDMLLTGTTPAALSDSSVQPDTSFPYGGVFYSDLLSVPFLSTKGGDTSYVYAYSGGSWITSGVHDSSFRDFEELVIGGQNVVVVGSESGYVELVFDGTALGSALTLITPGLEESGSVTTNANYLNTDLASTVIGSMFADVADGESYLFACTSGQGLWINFFQDPDRVWGRE